MKIVDCCESNKQMGWVCVAKIRMKPCKLQGITPATQGGLDKKAGCVKNVGNERKVKKRLWVKNAHLKPQRSQ